MCILINKFFPEFKKIPQAEKNKKYAYSESVFNTLCIEIKHKRLKKISSNKINTTKICINMISYMT